MNSNESFLDEAMRRTSLSSSNQMEMLSFRLSDNQLYGINVFKIIEIIECPERLAHVPHSHAAVKGIVNFRDEAISVIDLSTVLELEPVSAQQGNGYLVVCEYNNQLNAFLVSEPESLLTRSWDEIRKPEGFNSKALVAIAYSDQDEMVLILDIEGILMEVVGIETLEAEKLDDTQQETFKNTRIMLVDDSSTAMLMMSSTMEQMGFAYTTFDSAVKALEYLKQMRSSPERDNIGLIVSDIEMPGLDGFSFTRALRQMTEFSATPVILHSSMSNPTNRLKAEEAGADSFLGKFDSAALGREVLSVLNKSTS
ncbi:MAG: chemotaxis protein [Desulfuromonadaceae bacterium]